METKYLIQPVLLVEDNPVDLDLTLRAFSSQKFNNPIDVARDGEEALEYLEKLEEDSLLPLVILLDLKLPKISGLKVLEVIKKHPVLKTIPVVILTTSSESTDVETAYQLGVNSYIVKPVDFGKFIEVAKQIELYWCLLNQPV
jgi:CheY-like chemotaxis protein